MIEPKAFQGLRFEDAAELWLDSHRKHIAAKTVLHYTNCIKALAAFFAQLKLTEIHIGHFDEYQQMRLDGKGGLRPAGPVRVNHELNTLSQLLTRAALWAPIAPYYKPLKLPRPKAGVALSEDQERTLFRVACSRPRWQVAYLCSLVTANTTAGPGEIRMLRILDVDITPGASTPFGTIAIVLGAKNEFRQRTIPLNRTAGAAVCELVKRAQELGAVSAEHFLLPHRAAAAGQGWDPTRPMSSWRKAWDNLRAAAGLPGLRMYDLRHHVITRLLESENVSERTVIELAGHVSKKMLDTYSHIRMKSKLEGVLALEQAVIDDVPPEKKPPASAGKLRTEKVQ